MAAAIPARRISKYIGTGICTATITGWNFGFQLRKSKTPAAWRNLQAAIYLPIRLSLQSSNQLRHLISTVLRLRKFARMFKKSVRHTAVTVKMNRDAGPD